MVEISQNNLRDKYWRMNNLYTIIDKQGEQVRFRFNGMQQTLWDELWYLNTILKARQEGCTTFVDLYFLDECLFNNDIETAIVAHTKVDAQDIFRRKIQFPYDHLDPEIKKMSKLTTDSKSAMSFSNGSTLSVGTSFRGSTLQYLHVSELGKIASAHPEKAREIMSGALQAVAQGETLVFIESTGHGKTGVYYELCETAKKLQQASKTLTRMDFRLHFFPWYDCPDYVLDEPVALAKDMVKYLAEMQAKTGVRLSKQQTSWYVKKHAQLGEDTKREFPFTPEEAFEAGVIGTYFKSQFVKMRQDGRITNVPHYDGVVVDTWWDLGMDDTMTIWFTQDVGRELHCINYYENNGEGLEFYRDVLDDYRKELKYRYGRTVAPHDIKVRELGTGVSRLEAAHKMGLNMETAPKVEKKMDSIQSARSLFSICWFDEQNCDKGLEHLEEYRKQWDDINGVYKDAPMHDQHSHGADSFQTLAISHDFRTAAGGQPRARRRQVVIPSSRGWT